MADNPLVCAHHFNLRDAMSNHPNFNHFSSICSCRRYCWCIYRFCAFPSWLYQNKTTGTYDDLIIYRHHLKRLTILKKLRMWASIEDSLVPCLLHSHVQQYFGVHMNSVNMNSESIVSSQLWLTLYSDWVFKYKRVTHACCSYWWNLLSFG